MLQRMPDCASDLAGVAFVPLAQALEVVDEHRRCRVNIEILVLAVGVATDVVQIVARVVACVRRTRK